MVGYRKRKRLLPDNRLDWRDPDMPIIRKVLINGKEEVREIPPQLITNYYNAKINNDRAYWVEGHWSKDPSYWWADRVNENRSNKKS